MLLLSSLELHTRGVKTLELLTSVTFTTVASLCSTKHERGTKGVSVENVGVLCSRLDVLNTCQWFSSSSAIDEWLALLWGMAAFDLCHIGANFDPTPHSTHYKPATIHDLSTEQEGTGDQMPKRTGG